MNSRRNFAKTLGASALAFPFIGWKTTAGGAPSSHLRFAVFGSAGRAAGNISSMNSVANVSMVAVAEIDTARSAKTMKSHPKTKFYQDWRELLDKEADNIDAVIVSTPDHMHAPIAMSAMQLGKHAYCEKPLTRTIHECRALQTYAHDNKLATQMGIQIGSTAGNKTAVKWLRDEAIGKVIEVNSMVPKSWGSMNPLPTRVDEIPGTLDWDGWLGVGKQRDYISREFHPSQWRKRIGYGTGTLGDMGCHIYHPWYQGLNQPNVLSITSHGPGPVDADSWPLNSRVIYEMQGNDQTQDEVFQFNWYDGRETPGESVVAATGGSWKNKDGKTVSNVPKSGSVVIGTKGAMVIPHANAMPTIYRNGKLDPNPPEPAEAGNHHGDWAAAIRGEATEPPVANWDYAGPMSEAVLLGTIAQQIPGKTLNWDTTNLRFTNSNVANELVNDTYREGWEVTGL